MNFNGLTKEAKVEFSQILYTIAQDPFWAKQKELILLVREAVAIEIRSHIQEDIKKNKCETIDCTKALSMAAGLELDHKTVDKIVDRLQSND